MEDLITSGLPYGETELLLYWRSSMKFFEKSSFSKRAKLLKVYEPTKTEFFAKFRWRSDE